MVETYDNWIGGGWREPARRMETTTPFTGEVWATVADDPAAVDAAVAAARAAFEGEWGAMSGAERGRCMRRLGETLEARGRFGDSGAFWSSCHHRRMPPPNKTVRMAMYLNQDAGFEFSRSIQVLPVQSSQDPEATAFKFDI